MKKLGFILALLYVATGFSQTKIWDDDNVFKVQIGSQKVLYYQKGEYEVYEDGSSRVGIRNVNSGVVTVAPQVYTSWRVEGNTLSSKQKLLDSLNCIFYANGGVPGAQTLSFVSPDSIHISGGNTVRTANIYSYSGSLSDNRTVNGGGHILTFNGSKQIYINQTTADNTDFDVSKLFLGGGSTSTDTSGCTVLGFNGADGNALSLTGINTSSGVGVSLNGSSSGVEGIKASGTSDDSTGCDISGTSTNGRAVKLGGVSTNGFGVTADGFGTVGTRITGSGTIYGATVEGYSTHDTAVALSLEGKAHHANGLELYGNTAGTGAGVIIQGNDTSSSKDIVINPVHGKLQVQNIATDNSTPYVLAIDSASQAVTKIKTSTIGGGSGETVVTLGTITYADLNAAAADPTVRITTAANFPAHSYAIAFFVDVTTAFESAGNPLPAQPEITEIPIDGMVDPILGTTPLVLGVFQTPIFLGNVYKVQIPFSYSNSNSNPGQIDISSASTISPLFDFSLCGGNNPKDFTAGSVTIKAIVKSFP